MAFLTLVLLSGLGACGSETRPLETQQPQTPPNGPNNPRIPYYDENNYQVSQGGRYARWYGCESCHGPQAQGPANLGDDQWQHGGSFDAIYAFTATGHSGPLAEYGKRIPAEQLWQITAYVHKLESVGPEMRRRQSFDAAGEPQGADWKGPVR